MYLIMLCFAKACIVSSNKCTRMKTRTGECEYRTAEVTNRTILIDICIYTVH
jgi:hypothetical protein